MGMKLCLISPPCESDVKRVLEVTLPPLGLAYLASVLRGEHDVEILDALALNHSLADLRRRLEASMPDVVGITSVTSTIYNAYAVARVAKEVNENCIVVVGGPHATFMARQILEECPFVDVVVKGEGERAMKLLVEALSEGRSIEDIKGIAFRRNDVIAETEPMPLIENLDALPFPSRDLLPNEKYRAGRTVYTTMMTSRGCPFTCIFCSSARIFGNKWRGRSPENVVAEIKEVIETYRIKTIEVLDDTFTFNRERAARIADTIIDEGLDVIWSASSRVNTITRTLAEKMKRAGCRAIYLGIESGCQRMLDRINKGTTLEQARNAVEIVKKAGMQTVGSFIIGIPGETADCLKKTITFAKKIGIDFAQFTLLTPYPGTAIFTIADKNGWLMTKDWSKYTTLNPVMKIPGFGAEQLATFLRRAYLSFYLSPKVIWNQLKRRQFKFVLKEITSAINYTGRLER
ncbi:MAG: radical SAM protein [Methanophagales archaeon ANME-1-THS]|nr:MAG: radical SAM protein [Methanophagales archaeon ANME-1-THS]